MPYNTESNDTLRVLNYFLQYTYKQTITSYPQSLIPSVCAQAFEKPTYFQPRFSNDQQAFCPRHGLNISKSISLSSTAFYSLLMDMTSRCEERFGLLCHVSQYKVYFKISFSLKRCFNTKFAPLITPCYTNGMNGDDDAYS